MLERWHEPARSLGLLILRLGIGGYILTHGWAKLQRVLDGDYGFSDPIGIGSGPSLALMIFAEFFCALLVMAGLATRLAAVPIVIGMAVAAFVAHGADPWTAGEGARLFMTGQSERWSSKEPALMYLVVFLALVFTGPGRLSLDRLITGRRRDQRREVATPVP